MEDEIDLQTVLSLLRRRKRRVLTVFLVILVVGIVVTAVTPPIYEATILLFPLTYSEMSQTFPPPNPLASSAVRFVTNPYGYPSTLAEVAQSDTFIQETVAHLGVDAAALRIKAVWLPDSLDVRLTVRASTPGTAQRVSEALAASLVQKSADSTKPLRSTLEHLRDQAHADALRYERQAEGVRKLSTRLSQIANPTPAERHAQAVALETMTTANRQYEAALERERSFSLRIDEVSGVRVIGSKAVETQVAPRRRLNMIITTALGLLGALVAGFTPDGRRSQLQRSSSPGTRLAP